MDRDLMFSPPSVFSSCILHHLFASWFQEEFVIKKKKKILLCFIFLNSRYLSLRKYFKSKLELFLHCIKYNISWALVLRKHDRKQKQGRPSRWSKPLIQHYEADLL